MSKIVVIGGSAGALSVLKRILSELPADFPAAILVVTHIGMHSSMLPQILSRSSTLPVRHAVDGELIHVGQVLLAPSDEHLTVVTDGKHSYTRLLHGPRENHCRPAIDPLFRSASAVFGPDAIGVLLSGYLDDGTVGLLAIKTRGGTVIVQNPSDADAPDMPSSAIQHVEVDRTLDATEIGKALITLVDGGTRQDDVPNVNKPSGDLDWIDIENRLIGRDSDMDDLEQIGKRSALTCPECHGALWELQLSGPKRYRCHTGHAFTASVLATLQTNNVEDALWGAIRALHEQERLFDRMREQALQLGHDTSAAEYQANAAQAKARSQSLRDLVVTGAVMVKPEVS